MTDYWVVVEGDTNDADYISRRTRTDTEEIRVRMIPVLKAIRYAIEVTHKDKHFYNWPISEYRDNTPHDVYEGILTEDQIDWFEELYVPYCQDNIHSITSVKLFPYEEPIELMALDDLDSF